ncbi:MAG: YARHG domain-containing protein [Lachnospiraceae bacterium]|nr:YARHG domain-containing protein [Lachnospiraceae bacterium]
MKECTYRMVRGKGRLLALACLFFIWSGIRVRANEAYGYILPGSSSMTYSEAELAGMPPQVLCYAKNEVFARNGCMFVSGELQSYFNQQYWYTPVWQPAQFSMDMLNTYEVANVELLTSLEQRAGGYELDQTGYSFDPVYAYMDGYASDYDSYTVDPDSYIFYDSDSRYLTEQELQALSLQELCYAKNEIYARHGRLFRSSELQGYFNQKNWYWGFESPDQFSDSVLNSFEVTNAALLQAAEDLRAAGGYALDQPGYSYEGIGSYTGWQVYVCDEQDYIFPDSAQRYLTEAEVSSLSIQQLCYARNEIYARRGYVFKSQELRDYFGSKPWYYPTIPADSFSSSVLNVYETANVELLRRFEYSISPNGYALY